MSAVNPAAYRKTGQLTLRYTGTAQTRSGCRSGAHPPPQPRAAPSGVPCPAQPAHLRAHPTNHTPTPLASSVATHATPTDNKTSGYPKDHASRAATGETNPRGLQPQRRTTTPLSNTRPAGSRPRTIYSNNRPSQRPPTPPRQGSGPAPRQPGVMRAQPAGRHQRRKLVPAPRATQPGDRHTATCTARQGLRCPDAIHPRRSRMELTRSG